MADVLNIGLSGLNVAQRSLTTTGHNISNVNTDGYTRQTVEQATREPQQYGTSYLGSGVSVTSIKRIYDQFLVNQVQSNTASFNSIDTYKQYATNLDNLLGDTTSGLSTGMESFFAAMQQVANDPSSQASRQALLGQSQTLADKIHFINESLNQQNTQINVSMRNTVADINSIADSIAQLNQKIVSSPGSDKGNTNDLLDKRDAALTSLSKLVKVTAVPQDNGALNVFIGNGQSLVVGAATQPLTIVANKYDSNRSEVGFTTGGTSVQISSQLSGGSLGGLLDFRSQMLDPTRNALGQLAMGMADTINTQHHLGMDLNGQLGGDMFSYTSPMVTPSTDNAGAGAVSATLLNVNNVTTSDYKLTFNGGNSYTLTRQSDGQNFAIDTGGASPYTTAEIDGISLKITAGAVAGDTFLVQPTRFAADNFDLTINDPTKIAAAVPVVVAATLGNTGSASASPIAVNKPGDKVAIQFTGAATYNVVDQTTGATLAQGLAYTSGSSISFNGWTTQITDGGTGPASGDIFYVDQGVASSAGTNTGGASISQAVVNPPDPNLTDPVTITFTSPTTFNVTGATTGTPTVGASYTSGGVISYNGWNFTITGTPATGDSFTISPNSSGLGDNGNALQIASLQSDLTLNRGASSYQDAYGQLVADVGAKTQAAGISHDSINSLLQQSIAARDAVSGVNLDEEAANMIKFQQAYQAAAKVIAMSETLFQSILSAIGG